MGEWTLQQIERQKTQSDLKLHEALSCKRLKSSSNARGFSMLKHRYFFSDKILEPTSANLVLFYLPPN